MATAPARPKEATENRPLTPEERKLLRDLMARETATQSVHAPEVRIGEPYVALTNLSLPRRGDKEKMTDLVMKGEVVYLTEEEARPLLRDDPMRDGRQTPVIRKAHGPESTSDVPFLLPKLLSGARTGPPQGARQDPAGSSYVIPGPPEANPPVPGSEATGGQETAERQPQQEALDLPPTRPGARGLRDQVSDPGLIDAVRANMPRANRR